MRGGLTLKQCNVIMTIVVLGVFFLSCGLSWADEFDQFIMPMSNPVYTVGGALNKTFIRPVYIYQHLPSRVDTVIDRSLGIEDLPLGGHVRGGALQAGISINRRLSILAVKSGYINIRPDNTLSDSDGWVDLAAGVQYSFFYSPETKTVISGRLIYEFANGSDQVYQGNGDGNIAPSLLFLKGIGRLELAGAMGFTIPLNAPEEDYVFFDSWHASYEIFSWFHPLIEINHFYTIKAGSRSGYIRQEVEDEGLGTTVAKSLSSPQEDDLVASIATFNGCDIINLGGENSSVHRNFATMALGVRFPITRWLTVGYAYEFNLTPEENGLLADRHYGDVVITIPFSLEKFFK